MQLLLTNSTGTWDISRMVDAVRWSGDYQQIARTLNFGIISSAADKSVPVADCPLGCAVRLVVNGEALFDGIIRSRTKSTEGKTIDITCYDRGFELRRNKVLKTYSGKTPRAIVTELASLFGIETGDVADPGVPITRNFVTGNDSIDDVVRTAYTLASRTTRKQYHIGFRGRKLYVTEKQVNNQTLVIQGGGNLIAASTTESVENMVNAVQIYDKNNRFVQELKNREYIKLYGRLQEIVRQAGNDDKRSEAQKLLDEGGIEQKITVDCLGNVANITGGAAVLQEPHTGLYGLFYIDGDTHEWKRGQYYNKLVLNFKNIMSEKEAGSLPNANGGRTRDKGAVGISAPGTDGGGISFEHGHGWNSES